MKLLREISENVEILTEEKEDGNKNLYISGIFLQAETKNRNGRLYPQAVMESAVTKYTTEFVNTNGALGELSHPESPTINPDRVSHRVTNLVFEGSNVKGKALILNTPTGQIIKGLLEGGARVGVSSRGMGSLVQKENVSLVEDGYQIRAIDAVLDPSAPDAFVDAIMEQREWVYENGIFEPKEIENYETEIRRKPVKKMTELYRDFLSKI